jgi:hypothetical protein
MGHMDMGGGAMTRSKSPANPDTALIGPDSMLHVTLREPGEYKLWLQFRGGDALYVAPFVVIGRDKP